MQRTVLSSEQAKEARLALGLSQGRVATKLGINRSYVSQYESGRYLFGDEQLAAMREFYESAGFEFHQEEDDETGRGGDSGRGIRLMDGFVVPPSVSEDEADRILSEYAENARRICELAGRQVQRDFLGFLDEEERDGCRREGMTLMARNYALIEELKGHHTVLPCLRPENDTVGEFIGQGFAELLGLKEDSGDVEGDEL